jgi:hypothetical protein
MYDTPIVNTQNLWTEAQKVRHRDERLERVCRAGRRKRYKLFRSHFTCASRSEYRFLLFRQFLGVRLFTEGAAHYAP